MSPVQVKQQQHTFTDSNGDKYRVLDFKHVAVQTTQYGGDPSYVNIAVPTWSVPLDGVVSVFSAVRLDDEKDRRIHSLTRQVADLEQELRVHVKREIDAIDILQGSDDE